MPSVRITRRIVDPITFCERVGLEFVPRGIEDFILDETIGMAYTLPRHKPRLEQQQHHQPPPSPLPESSVLTTLEHQHHPPAPPSPVPESSVLPALQQSPDEKESSERELEESSSSSVPRGIEDFILDETIGIANTLPPHKPTLEQQQHHQPPPSPLPESSVLTTLEHQHHPPAPPSPVPDSSVVIPALQQSPDEKESPERELEESSSSESSSSGSSSSESSSSESSSAGSSSSEASSSEDEDVPINRVVRPPSPPIPPSPTGKSPRKSPRKSSLISPSPRRTMKVSLKNLQKTSLLQIMERFPTTPDLSMDEASMNSDEYLGGVQQPLDDGKKHVRFADEIDVKQYSKSGASVFDDLFYASHDLAEFRYEAFMEEAGLDMAEYD